MLAVENHFSNPVQKAYEKNIKSFVAKKIIYKYCCRIL